MKKQKHQLLSDISCLQRKALASAITLACSTTLITLDINDAQAGSCPGAGNAFSISATTLTSRCDLTGTDSLTLSNSGNIIVNDDSSSILVDGSATGVTISNDGNIELSLTGTSSGLAAILINATATGTTLTNNGSITASETSTTDAEIAGINFEGFLDGALTNAGNISATAANGQNGKATGLVIGGGTYSAPTGGLSGMLTNTNTGSITASVTGVNSPAANGIYVSNLSGSIINDGMIQASVTGGATPTTYALPPFGVGIWVTSGSGSLINNSSGVISASASNQPVAYAYGLFSISGDMTLTNDGEIGVQLENMTAALAAGAIFYDSYTGSLTNSATGTISATATGVNFATITPLAGVNFAGGMDGTLTNSGLISARANDVVYNGTVTYFGNGMATVAGINVDYGFGGVLDNSGTISAVIDNQNVSRIDYGYASGIKGNMGGMLDNSGDITASITNAEYAAAYGIQSATSFSGTVTNSGNISASAAHAKAAVAFGAFAYDFILGGGISGTFDNSGAISASVSDASENGAAFGMFLGEAVSGSLTNSGTISARVDNGSGDAVAEGISIFNPISGTLTNDGDITATALSNADIAVARGIRATSRIAGLLVGIPLPPGGAISGTLTNNGNISALASGANDVFATALSFKALPVSGAVDNSGVISATAQNATNTAAALAVDLSASNPITSFLSAFTSAFSFNIIINFGDISGTLTNSGTISAMASNAASVYATGLQADWIAPGGTLENSGTISASATNGNKAYAAAIEINSATLFTASIGAIYGSLSNTNSGVISATASGTSMATALGLAVAADVTGNITNNGLIQAVAGASAGTAMATGIAVNDEFNGVLDNSGTIIAAISSGSGNSYALNFATGTGTVNNLASGLISADAFLLGGSINLSNSGTISISQDSTVGGDYTQAAGSTLEVIVNSDTADDSGKIIVSGDVDVDPASTVFINTGTLSISDGQTYTILDGSTGNVDTATNLPSISGSAVYTFTGMAADGGSDLIVTLAPSTVFNNLLGGSYNSRSILNSGVLSDPALQGIATVLGYIDEPGDYIAALESLSGYQHNTNLKLNSYLTQKVLQLVQRHRRHGYWEQGLASFNPMQGPLVASSESNLQPGGVLASASAAAASQPTSRSTRNWWLKAYASNGDIDHDGFMQSMDYRESGLALGADIPLSDTWSVGFAGSYTNSDIDGEGSNSDVDSYQIAAYSNWSNGDWYIDAAASYAWHDTDTSRTVTVGVLTGTAQSDYDSDTLAASIEFGKDITLGNGAMLTPYAGLEYARTDREDFTETSSFANLSVNDEEHESMRSKLGIRLSKTYKGDNGIAYTPGIHAAYVHEHGDNDNLMTTAFSAAPTTTYTIKGHEIDRDRLQLGAGITVNSDNDMQLHFGYDGEYSGSDDYHSLSATLRMQWY